MIAPRGARLMEALAWLGLALSLVCFGASAHAGPPRDHHAAAMPTPQEITAYTTAICAAVLTAMNTLFIIWHKLQRPRKPRRKKKASGTPPPS